MRYSMLFAVLFATACGGKTPQSPAPAPPTAPPAAPEPTVDNTVATGPQKPVTTATLQAIGLDPTVLDRSADPCADFYQFACGGYLKTATIDADKPMAMRTFVDIPERNTAYEHDALETARTRPGNDPIAKQLGAYYGSCMDEATIEKIGIAPLKPLLASIATINDARSLAAELGTLRADGFKVLFEIDPTPDAANAQLMIAQLDQGGIGLPDRDYYLNDDAGSTALRAKYHDYVASLLVATGRDATAAAADADKVIALETAIAKVSKDKVARRDPKGTYNKVDRAGLAAAMPHFAWGVYWAKAGLPKTKDVTVTSKELIAGLDPLIESTPPDVWRTYVTAHVMSSMSSQSTAALEHDSFVLAQAMIGVAQQEPRWHRCTEQTDGVMGDLIGQWFVRDRFGGDSKAAADADVRAISEAMAANLAALPWMDDQTRVRAAAKLKAMAYQIGYPKQWKPYVFKISPTTWTANALAARKARAARALAKIEKPVDRDDWQMTAPTVNAYYDPTLNGMVFPAGILQPPFYSASASIPVNLGGIGMVVGHELTHGFDDQGAQYDEVGNLTDWWQPETSKQFKAKTQCVIDQYNGYKVGPTSLNGANTLGENIADIGGIKLAFNAYRTLRAAAPDQVVADGFTEDQQFFLSFGQSWCSKARPELEKMLATVDVHSPAQWRVNGALSATPAFATAFKCKLGTKMAPKNACVVW